MNNRINSIPLRISITGTRGKTSVVRMLASILREDGKKVLAKTTGSQAQIILSDGKEINIPRRGITSIIEQKKLISKAAAAGADCIIAEIMSIHPENHFVESQQIIKPNIVVLTNVRVDHTDAMGETEEEIASVFSLDFPNNATVFVPEEENSLIIKSAVQNRGGTLKQVSKGNASHLFQRDSEAMRKHFSDNIDLLYALGEHLNIDQKVILDGIRKAQGDIGSFKIWKHYINKNRATCYLVNGFAANDPESTLHVISLLKDILPPASNNITGLLNLRSDRGDRTAQWIEALNSGEFDFFSRLYVTGAHAKIVERKVQHASVIKSRAPETIMKTIMGEIGEQAVIFGFGNIGGAGRLLIEYWNIIGENYELL